MLSSSWSFRCTRFPASVVAARRPAFRLLLIRRRTGGEAARFVLFLRTVAGDAQGRADDFSAVWQPALVSNTASASGGGTWHLAPGTWHLRMTAGCQVGTMLFGRCFRRIARDQPSWI